MKRLEKPILLVKGDSHAVVANTKDNLVRIAQNFQANFAPIRRIFYGICQQVEQDVSEQSFVQVCLLQGTIVREDKAMFSLVHRFDRVKKVFEKCLDFQQCRLEFDLA